MFMPVVKQKGSKNSRAKFIGLRSAEHLQSVACVRRTSQSRLSRDAQDEWVPVHGSLTIMKKKILFAMFAAYVFTAQAQFSGQGSGTEKDPYQITNADELFEVRNALTAYYIVMNDIDLTQWIDDDNPKNGWNPIGTKKTAFKGNFNGNNKLITGLKISRENNPNIGLFGYTDDASIYNVILINPIITGGDNTGGIVGYALALLRHMTDFWPILAGAVCSAHPCYSQRTLL